MSISEPCASRKYIAPQTYYWRDNSSHMFSIRSEDTGKSVSASMPVYYLSSRMICRLNENRINLEPLANILLQEAQDI
jgi:hypothetical protein